jgi:Acetyltransferase (GNAT) domain
MGSREDMRVTSPVPRSTWESLARSDGGAIVTQSPAWHDAVLASGRYRDVSVLYEFDSGQKVIMPMARYRWQPPQVAVVESWPSDWSVGGPLCQDGEVTAAEAAAVLADVARRASFAARIRLGPHTHQNWISQALQYKVTPWSRYVLDLSGGFEHVWRDKFRGVSRTAVRKAERSELDIEVDRSGNLISLFGELYENFLKDRSVRQDVPLWLTRMRMNRESPTSPRQIRLVADSFGKDCATWVVRLNGDPLVSIITLQFGESVLFFRIAADKPRADPVRASEYLHRVIIEQACRDGYRFYDMGAAPPGSSLARYKEKLGAVESSTYLLSFDRLPARVLYDARGRAENLAGKAVRLRQH